MNKPKLESDRLLLQPLETTDLATFHQMNIEPHIREFLWDNEVISEQTSREILIQNKKHFEEDRYGLWKIVSNTENQWIGYTGLWYFFEESQPQLIYALLKEFTGRGLATEAATLVMKYAFTELGFDYLIASTDEPHTASQKVAHRLGMKLSEKKIINNQPTLFFRIERSGSTKT